MPLSPMAGTLLFLALAILRVDAEAYDLRAPPSSNISPAIQHLTEFGHQGEEHVVNIDNGTMSVAIVIHRLRNQGAIPIVLVPGIVTSSLVFLSAGRESFGYLLADAGYDVWLLNTRGSGFSRKLCRNFTSSQNCNSNEVWEGNPSLTIEHDLPILFEHIIEKTRHRSTIHAVGFSQGCMLIQGMLSTNERLNSIVDLVINVGPHMHFKGAAWNMMRIYCRILNILSYVPALGFQRMPIFHPNSALMQIFFGDKCRRQPALCRFFVHLTLSPLSQLLSWRVYGNYNITNYAKYWGTFTPIGSATSHMIHADRSENIGFARYQSNPWDDAEAYHLERVKAAQIMYYCAGDKDVTGSAEQNEWMVKTFGRRLRFQLILGDGCTHPGFILDSRGEDYRRIIAEIQKFDAL